ncbi:MAG TPA: tetratricopeptide repeat protein, partial [Chryseolinea sp.]
MARLYITLFCCLWIERSIAQIEVIDSLMDRLQIHTRADTNRVNILNALSDQYQWLDFNSSYKYAAEALMLAESLSFRKGIATANSRQAQSFWSLGDSERAIEKALHALDIAEKDRINNVLAETYRIMAICYRDQQDLDKAAYYVRRAEQLAIQEKDWDLMARIYNAAGVIAYSRNLTDSAMIYYNKSLQISNEHDTRRFHLSQVLSNMGEVYLEENVDKALDYFIRALATAKETNNRPSEAGIMGDIGRAFMQKKMYDDADRYLNQSLKMSRDLGLKRVSRYVYYALADLKLREGKTTEAFDYLKA